MKDNSLPTSKITRYSMSLETKIEKDKTFIFGRDMVVETRDGVLSILTKLLRKEVRDGTVNMDSISTDHSTSDQDSQ
jgi:hypothetical protein